ncbi:MAG: hypothetical protein R3B52_00820 [Candidatus Paceibacterota bacterium]
MKKHILIGIIVVLAIIALAILGGKDTTGPEEATEEMSGDIFDVITAAFKGEVSVRCEYELPDVDASSVTYIKGDSLRVDTVDELGQKFHIIYKDQTAYFWQADEKIGFIFEVPEVEVESGDDAMSAGVQSRAEIKAEIERFKDFCEQTAVSDSQFDPPSDVQFQTMQSFIP